MTKHKTSFKEADLKRALRAGLGSGFDQVTVEVDLPNGIKMRVTGRKFDDNVTPEDELRKLI